MTTKTRHGANEVIAACSAAADDLKLTRRLADALDAENASLRQRLEGEKAAAAASRELNEARRLQNEALRSALETAGEAATAKDAVISAQEKLIAELKNKKTSPWKRLGDILLGAAVIAVLK